MGDNRKYEVTGETRTVTDERGVSHTVHRIRALRELKPRQGHRVYPGELGGWVEHVPDESRWEYSLNLATDGECWVHEEATVLDQARVSGDACVTGKVVVSGRARVGHQALAANRVRVFGGAEIQGTARVLGDAQVYGHAALHDNVSVRDQARVHGAACLYGLTQVDDDANVSDVTMQGGVLREHALVSRHGQVLVLDGFLRQGMVTLYRTVDTLGHRLVAGCQTFTLDTDLERLARNHDWTLAPTWRSMRLALKHVVRGWQPKVPADKLG